MVKIENLSGFVLQNLTGALKLEVYFSLFHSDCETFNSIWLPDQSNPTADCGSEKIRHIKHSQTMKGFKSNKKTQVN